MTPDASLTVSIVSHRQAQLVLPLLEDLDRHCGPAIEVVLTVNVEETLPFARDAFRFPLRLIVNSRPMGFGANHNSAFRAVSCRYFCVLNPDIRLPQNPFPALLAALDADRIGVVAPLIVNPAGEVEDSARRFPTPASILAKALTRRRRADYAIGNERLFPDWVAGMFMLFPAQAFAAVGGFDERYFLYYEDVDLCARLRRAGFEVALEPRVSAIHAARRESHRNPRYLLWHAGSMARFFLARPQAKRAR